MISYIWRGWAIESRVRPKEHHVSELNPWLLQGVYADPDMRKGHHPNLEGRPMAYKTRQAAREVARKNSNSFTQYRVVRVEVTTTVIEETKP